MSETKNTAPQMATFGAICAEIRAERNLSKKHQHADENNRICKLDPDGLRVWYCGEYVHNIGAHIKALKKAHSDAEKAIEKAREAFRAYNDLIRGNIRRANINDGRIPSNMLGL